MGIVAPLLKQFDWVLAHTVVFRGLSYGLLVFLTLWQLLTVILSLTGPDIVKKFLAKHDASKRAADSIGEAQITHHPVGFCFLGSL